MLKKRFGIPGLIWNLSFGICHPASAAPELHDVRPPVDFPSNYWLVLSLLGVVVLVGCAFLFRYLIRRLRHRVPRVAPAKTAWDIAYERLIALEKENLPQRGLADAFYTRLSLIVRCYMEDRFLIRAPEMTTEEFFVSLKTALELTDRHKQALREFLNFSDMVKFARHTASVAEMEAGLALAKRLVDETKVTTMTESPAGKGSA